MSELWAAYWPVILVGLLIGIIVGYLVFRPRQRVTLSSETPVRPHMVAAPARTEGRGITDEAAAAASDVAGHMLGSNVRGQLPGAAGAPDDLLKLKGVGPKLAAMLNERGLIRFDQIASQSGYGGRGGEIR